MSEKTIEKHAFGAETGKILQLMIHSLYTNRDIFLRELISNASDACDKLRYEALSNPSLSAGDTEYGITVELQPKARTLVISDNGIGMNHDELVANLGTIARSGTQEFAKSLSGDTSRDVSLIGQFGVGFYSAFMVADGVSVHSTRAGQQDTWVWESEGMGEYTVRKSDTPLPRGTRITLHVREGEDEYLDYYRLKHIIQTYSDHVAFPITLKDDEGKSETANKVSALWMRPKSEISEEQYKEFYKHVAHSPDEPWLTLHGKAEGKLEYTYLLYIPSLKPFDLFHPDRKRRVKLYVKRVFITDEGADIIPHYLRFLRGVVDSEDLPLNISRETLQANPLLARIREAVAKKVLGELKKKLDSDAASYAAFWERFGAVVKEGLCEANTPREQILEICRFHTTHEDGVTGLDTYISRMPEKQEHIFYMTGDRLETLRGNPILEGFTRRGIEVLLLNDHVDDFWLSLVSEYKGKPFKSVTRADIDLDSIYALPQEDAKKDETPAADAESMQALLTRIKDTLGGYVQDVRTTSKLTSSPACLAVAEGAMDMRLERFLIEQKQLPGGTAKILEINPAHPIIKRLAANAGQDEAADVIWLLLDQARVVEGEDITDPAAFSRRINLLMEKSLAA